MSKWIEFEIVAPKSKMMKTSIYRIHPKESISETLGVVKWYAQWRKYCFFPEPNCVFETVCMGDIITFINELMEQRKKVLC